MSQKTRNALYGFVPFAVVVVILLLQSPISAAASNEADITIVPHNDLTASPGTSTEYSYLIINNSTVSSTTFTLSLEYDSFDWTVQFDDATDSFEVMIEAGGTETIVVEHRPPSDSGNTDRDWFELTATFDDESSVSTSNETTVQAEYGFVLSIDDPTKTASPGDNVTYRLQVDNIGLRTESDVSFSVVNPSNLAFETNIVDQDDDSLTTKLYGLALPQNATLMVDVEVMIRSDAADGTSETVTIEVVSEGLSAGLYKRQIQLTTSVYDNTATPTSTPTPTPTAEEDEVEDVINTEPTPTRRPTATSTPNPNASQQPDPSDPLEGELSQLLDEIGELLTQILLENIRESLDDILAELELGERIITATPPTPQFSPCTDNVVAAVYRQGRAVEYNEDFAAALGADGVILSWSTSAETNTSAFAIQRETDEDDFVDLAPDLSSLISVSQSGGSPRKLVVARGDASTGSVYSVVDSEAIDGTTHYYRLIEIESNNDFHVLDFIAVDLEAFETATPTPTPTSTSTPTATPCATKTATLDPYPPFVGEATATATLDPYPPFVDREVTATATAENNGVVSHNVDRNIGEIHNGNAFDPFSEDGDGSVSAVDITPNGGQTHSSQSLPLMAIVVMLLTVTLYCGRAYSR